MIRGKSSARPLVAVQRLPPDVSDSGFDFKKVSFLEFFDFSEIFTPKYFRGTSLPGILKEERQKCKDVYRVWGGQRRRTPHKLQLTGKGTTDSPRHKPRTKDFK